MKTTHTPREFAVPAITVADDLLFGNAPRPVSCGHGLRIGAGTVYPEINFTLPPMLVTSESWSDVHKIYDATTAGLLERARDLALEGLASHLVMHGSPRWVVGLEYAVEHIQERFGLV